MEEEKILAVRWGWGGAVTRCGVYGKARSSHRGSTTVLGYFCCQITHFNSAREEEKTGLAETDEQHEKRAQQHF